MSRNSLLIRSAMAALVFVCSGCATYHPTPLPENPALISHVESLRSCPGMKENGQALSVEVDPKDGLDLTEIAVLAVLNNPDLKAVRAQVKVAGAQVFAAGLLPDPQISANLDIPTGSTMGLVNGWGLGLAYDIVALITRQARINAERRDFDQVNLGLLWQEWQVIQEARIMCVRSQFEERRLALLKNMLNLYMMRYQRSSQGMAEGHVTLDVNGTDLVALVDTYSQINQIEQVHNETRHSLNLLLGLIPDVEVPLTVLPDIHLLSKTYIKKQCETLTQRRPDLLALKAGYQSQEAKVRAAVLAWFPAISVGVDRASDTSNVHTTGFSISLDLPLFSGNRGAIAVERATLKQLRAEYQARIAQTRSDVSKLTNLQDIISRQRALLKEHLPRLKILVDRARRAYTQGDIEATTFLNMESTWTNKKLEQIGLEQNLWENRIALETLLTLPETVPAGLIATPAHQKTVKKKS